jgi:hypothetical protein
VFDRFVGSGEASDVGRSLICIQCSDGVAARITRADPEREDSCSAGVELLKGGSEMRPALITASCREPWRDAVGEVCEEGTLLGGRDSGIPASMELVEAAVGDGCEEDAALGWTDSTEFAEIGGVGDT